MKLLIHGGFFSEFDQSDSVKKAKQVSMENIIKKSYDFMESNSALETVVYAVELLENDALYNAGMGSQIQSDGKIRMSAALMDGESQKFSGVINIEGIKNPIQVAKKLASVDDRVLGGSGATQFAVKNGFEKCSVETSERRKEFELKLSSKGLGTVGCVAFDSKGKLAAATSTGGKGFEIPGRISDSATVAGNYSNGHCAVSCTGVGEDIVSGAVATKIVTRVTDGMEIQKAFTKTFDELTPYDGFAGAIGIDKQGNWFWQESHPKIVFAAFDGKELITFN